MAFNVLRSLTRVLAGMLVALIGYGMYISPELTWSGFLGTCALILQGAANEIGRFLTDPFAALGFAMFLIGFWLIVEGLKNLILGRRSDIDTGS